MHSKPRNFPDRDIKLSLPALPRWEATQIQYDFSVLDVSDSFAVISQDNSIFYGF